MCEVLHCREEMAPICQWVWCWGCALKAHLEGIVQSSPPFQELSYIMHKFVNEETSDKSPNPKTNCTALSQSCVFNPYLTPAAAAAMARPQIAPGPSCPGPSCVEFSPWASQRRRQAFTSGCLEVWGINIPWDTHWLMEHRSWWVKAPRWVPWEDNCVVYFMWLFRRSHN